MMLTKILKRIYTGYSQILIKRLEKKNFHDRLLIARSKVKTYFFISGALRSGTSWLRFMLNTHPQVAVTGEGRFIGHENSVDSWFSEEMYRKWG